MDAPLATTADAAAYGYTLPADPAGSALLARASARVRLAVSSPIEQTTSTVRLAAHAGKITLPALPVTDVAEVVRVERDGTISDRPVEWWRDWRSGDQVVIGDWYRWRTDGAGAYDVTFTHGFPVIPDPLIELVCAVANRYAGIPDGAEGGLRSKTVGSVSWTIDAASAGPELTPAELLSLSRILPVQRAWAVELASS